MKSAWQRHLGKVGCPRCSAKYHEPVIGSYRCLNCGFREDVEQALVRTCREQAEGEPTKEEIAKYAGITLDRLEKVHRDLKEELYKLEQEKHACSKCGSIIMYGRYCESCKKEMMGDMFRLF